MERNLIIGAATGYNYNQLKPWVESIDEVKKINEDIKETESIIEYLEKVEKVYSSLTYDIKNMIQMTSMEQL